jgi:hypothetical protein
MDGIGVQLANAGVVTDSQKEQTCIRRRASGRVRLKAPTRQGLRDGDSRLADLCVRPTVFAPNFGAGHDVVLRRDGNRRRSPVTRGDATSALARRAKVC